MATADSLSELWRQGQVEWDDVKRLGRLETTILKAMIALFLLGLAVTFWFGRYSMLYSDHGELMVGIDYVQQNVGLPLQTAKAVAALLRRFWSCSVSEMGNRVRGRAADRHPPASVSEFAVRATE